jgi:hypothetical protein
LIAGEIFSKMGAKLSKHGANRSVKQREDEAENSADDRILKPSERLDYPEEHITTDSSASVFDGDTFYAATTTTMATSTVHPESQSTTSEHVSMEKTKSAVVRTLVGDAVHHKKVCFVVDYISSHF